MVVGVQDLCFFSSCKPYKVLSTSVIASMIIYPFLEDDRLLLRSHLGLGSWLLVLDVFFPHVGHGFWASKTWKPYDYGGGFKVSNGWLKPPTSYQIWRIFLFPSILFVMPTPAITLSHFKPWHFCPKGGILRVGDSVMGYDLRTLHLGNEPTMVRWILLV